MTTTLAPLDLFAQREAAPEVARPVARMAMPGAGQEARRVARERAHAKIDATYARIVKVLTAWPSGLTRSEIASQTGLVINSVNARVSELRGLPDADERQCYTEGRRGGESVVRLRRFRAS